MKLILAAAALALAATAAQAQSVSGALTLYTSQPQKDAQDTIDAFKKAHPNVDVKFSRDGTTQLMAKLRAEFAAGAPQPDVLLIADAMSMEALKKDKRLMAYAAANTAGMPAGSFDAEKTYFATKLITTGIVYNTKAPMKPTSWQDLTKPEVKGQLIMPSPLYSGAAAIHVGTLLREPGFGWSYFEALAKNGTKSARGNGAVLEAVASGQQLYGVIVDFMAIRAKDKGSPVEFVFPKEGVTAVTEPVAILSTAKNPAAAKAFVDFLLSPAGQGVAAAQGMMPARDGVAPPKGFPKLSEVKILAADTGALLAADEANKKKYAELFGQ
jgi:iron(III) transport system substrate-binding protein